MRRFTKTDWYGFSGATPFPDGSEPFIEDDIEIDGHEAELIVDAKGLWLIAYGYSLDGGDTECSLSLDHGVTASQFLASVSLRRAAKPDHQRGMPINYTSAELLAAGWTQ